MGYTHDFGAFFPERVLEERVFKDVDETVLELVTKIKNYEVKNDYYNARRVLDENEELLRDYMINADYINLIDEEIRNIEVFAKEGSQTMYYQKTEPERVLKNDVWIGV